MNSSLTMLKRAVPLACASFLVAGTAQAALEDRDLDGDTVVDAYYDTDLDVTWLRDASLASYKSWFDALAWADDFSFAGYSDWRLPRGDAACGDAWDCLGNEMAHLWYVELGNSAGAMTNPGGFNWGFYSPGATYYWTSTVVDLGYGHHAQVFEITTGYVGARVTFSWDFAMAVADGDVGMVPEPGTYALMLAGLAGLALATRRRQR